VDKKQQVALERGAMIETDRQQLHHQTHLHQSCSYFGELLATDFVMKHNNNKFDFHNSNNNNRLMIKITVVPRFLYAEKKIKIHMRNAL
jgi:hypothetical protein